MDLQMKELSKFRRGITGAIISIPFGLAAAGIAKRSDILLDFMGTEWALFKAVVGTFAMIGYGIGQSFYKGSRTKDDDTDDF